MIRKSLAYDFVQWTLKFGVLHELMGAFTKDFTQSLIENLNSLFAETLQRTNPFYIFFSHSTAGRHFTSK